MAMDISGDLLNMLNPLEFGTDSVVTIGATQSNIQGMYIDDYFEILNGTGMGVESTQPAYLCRSVDVPNVRHGDTILISGTVYAIVGVKPHGITGLVALQLETP